MKKYLFICGCGRSGTTALGKLLGSHPDLALGIERFHNLVIPDFKLEKTHFSKDRFFNFQKEDSHIRLSEKTDISDHYKKLEKRYENCHYYGDKIPLLYYKYNEVFETFAEEHNVKIIFIYRNVMDVLNSYNIRFQDQKDKWKRNIKVGMQDWNDALSLTDTQLKLERNILLLPYEDIYQNDTPMGLNKVLKFLGIANDEGTERYYKYQLKESQILTKIRKKKFSLSKEDVIYIEKNANTQLYEKFKANS